jgi:hypothetical protein
LEFKSPSRRLSVINQQSRREFEPDENWTLLSNTTVIVVGSNLPLGAYTAERSSLPPLQLIAKASSAALELAETGDMEPALKVLTQLAKSWK